MTDFRQRLLAGEPMLGTFINIVDNPDIVRIFQNAGLDYIVIDNEHGYMDYSKTANMIGFANAFGMPVIVRIPEPRREVVLKHLEMGADGLLLPCCDNKEKAEELVRHARYAPQGNRGVALFRAHTDYKTPSDGSEYMQKRNASTLLIGQIESEEAVQNAAEILDVSGLDGVFIGPNDLSQGLGIYGQMSHPRLLDAIEKVLAEVKKRPGKIAGIYGTGEPADLKPWIEKGMQFNIWGSETSMLLRQAKAVADAVK